MANNKIPSMIGGFPTSFDLAPSIIISAIYGASLIPFVVRLFRPQSRIILPILGTLIATVEHCIVYAIRTTSAHGTPTTAGKKSDLNLLFYIEWMLAAGYINMIGDVVALFRGLLVNTTLADPRRGSANRPELRATYRGVCKRYYVLLLIVALIGGIAASIQGTGKNTDFVIGLRYIGGLSGLAMIGVVVRHILMARHIQYMDVRALNYLLLICGLASISPIYRLAVMGETTPFLPHTRIPDARASGSLTSPDAKIAFYLLHVLPEVIGTLVIQSISIRRIFNSSMMGDWRKNDKKVVPRLLEGGQVVDGVGVDSTMSLKTAGVEGTNDSQVHLLRLTAGGGWREGRSSPDLESLGGGGAVQVQEAQGYPYPILSHSSS